MTGDKDAASDLLQDVFLRLNRFADRIDPNRPLEPWIYRVTVNLTVTWLKRRRWTRPIEEITEWFAREDKVSPAQLAEHAEEWQQLENALDQLPIAQRTALIMFYINDLAVQEIADVLAIPEGTVKSRLYYGRKALKEQLEAQRGILPAEMRYEFT